MHAYTRTRKKCVYIAGRGIMRKDTLHNGITLLHSNVKYNFSGADSSLSCSWEIFIKIPPGNIQYEISETYILYWKQERLTFFPDNVDRVIKDRCWQSSKYCQINYKCNIKTNRNDREESLHSSKIEITEGSIISRFNNSHRIYGHLHVRGTYVKLRAPRTWNR